MRAFKDGYGFVGLVVFFLCGFMTLQLGVLGNAAAYQVKIAAPSNDSVVSGTVPISLLMRAGTSFANVYVDGVYLASTPTTRHRRKRGVVSRATSGRRSSLRRARSDEPRLRRIVPVVVYGPGSRRPFPESMGSAPAKSDGQSTSRLPHGRNDRHSTLGSGRPTASLAVDRPGQSRRCRSSPELPKRSAPIKRRRMAELRPGETAAARILSVAETTLG